jgi:4-amino-4-deoxychorismate lyase
MILVNGAATDSVAATDRGLAYGDGVFRTLLLKEGVPRWWPRHYRKLERDCVSLALPCPPERLLAEEIARVTSRSADAVVKIIITRGSGTRGYAPPQPVSPTRVVMSIPVSDHPEAFGRDGIRIHWCRTRVSSQPRLAGVKHLNRLENVLARAEWNDPAVPEGLMLDEDGHVIGGTMTNLFISENGDLATPLLSRCGVAGVTRERVIEAAGKHGMSCREEPITRARLLDARAVLLVNSVIGVWQVSECAGRRWEPGDFAAHVREWLDEDGN